MGSKGHESASLIEPSALSNLFQTIARRGVDATRASFDLRRLFARSARRPAFHSNLLSAAGTDIYLIPLLSATLFFAQLLSFSDRSGFCGLESKAIRGNDDFSTWHGELDVFLSFAIYRELAFYLRHCATPNGIAKCQNLSSIWRLATKGWNILVISLEIVRLGRKLNVALDREIFSEEFGL
ncbi:hypothetical protein KM043_000459 [Ampulex compressa]|nr:hypothetical protein KM043_000459 [Ampulex compressa]